MQTIGERAPMHGDLGRFYDAIENPRKTRGELPILHDAELRSYMADVRERTLEVLEEVDISPDAENPLLRDGFVYEMLLAHEHQHNETMLQLLQMVEGYEPVRRDAAVAAEPVADGPEMVLIEAGEHEIGAGERRLRLRQRAPPPRGRDSPPSRSTARPSPTPTSPSSSRQTGAEPPLVLGARRRRAAGSTRRWAAATRSLPAHPVVHVSHEQADGLRRLGRQAAAERAGVGGRLRRS